MQDVLGHRLEGRGDYSMAFITLALEALAPGGVLGPLLPASLLTLEAAEAWRKDLLYQADALVHIGGSFKGAIIIQCIAFCWLSSRLGEPPFHVLLDGNFDFAFFSDGLVTIFDIAYFSRRLPNKFRLEAN